MERHAKRARKAGARDPREGRQAHVGGGRGLGEGGGGAPGKRRSGGGRREGWRGQRQALRQSRSVRMSGGSRWTFSLLCAQSDDPAKRSEAAALMKSRDYVARLSADILCYTVPGAASCTSSAAQEDLFCLPLRVIDDALPKACLTALQRGFCSDDCDYWLSHDYSVYPPSPYFSYVMPLPPSRAGEKAGVPLTSAGPLGHLIDTVRKHAEANFEGRSLLALQRFGRTGDRIAVDTSCTSTLTMKESEVRPRSVIRL